MSTDHPTLAEVGEQNIKGYLSQDQMREKIRAELKEEAMHPGLWYKKSEISKGGLSKRAKFLSKPTNFGKEGEL